MTQKNRCSLTNLPICRREMMPLLSLIFSALFILFGTVVIQAFRLVAQPYTRFYSTTKTFFFREKTNFFCPSPEISVWRSTKKIRGISQSKQTMLLLLFFYVCASPEEGQKKKTSLCFFSDSSEDKQTKPKAKDGTKTENGSPGTGGASRQEYVENFFIL